MNREERDAIRALHGRQIYGRGEIVALLDALDAMEAAIELALVIMESPSPFDSARPLLHALGRDDEFERVWRAAMGAPREDA